MGVGIDLCGIYIKGVRVKGAGRVGVARPYD